MPKCTDEMHDLYFDFCHDRSLVPERLQLFRRILIHNRKKYCEPNQAIKCKIDIFFLSSFSMQSQKFCQTTRPCTLIAFLSKLRITQKETSIERRERKTRAYFSIANVNFFLHKSNGAIIIGRQFVFSEWFVPVKLKHVLKTPNEFKMPSIIGKYNIQCENGSKIIDKRSIPTQLVCDFSSCFKK